MINTVSPRDAQSEAVIRLAYCVADFERFSPKALRALRQAAVERDGWFHLLPEDRDRLARAGALRALSGQEYLRGESRLSRDMMLFLRETVHVENDEIVLQCPLPDTHPAFERVVQALKSGEAHVRGRLRTYPAANDD